MKTIKMPFRILLVLAMMSGLANSTRAAFSPPAIKNTSVNDTAMTIEVVNFPSGPLTVKFNNATVSATYDQPAQRIAATLPAGLDPRTYLLAIYKDGNLFAWADVTIGAVGPQGPAGPPGPEGDKGATDSLGRASQSMALVCSDGLKPPPATMSA